MAANSVACQANGRGVRQMFPMISRQSSALRRTSPDAEFPTRPTAVHVLSCARPTEDRGPNRVRTRDAANSRSAAVPATSLAVAIR